jgi:signal transduction histidine kinase
VATLTHDLRTPLTAIKISAQLIHRRASDNEALQKLATKITNGIDRADEMIRDLLDASLIRAGQKLPIEIAPCNLTEVVAETIAELGTVYGDRFILSANQSIDGSWSANGVRRIVENLCGNAIKYGASQSPVHVALTLRPGSVAIEVKNDGPAIPLEDQGSLFEPFRRSSSAKTGGQKGWGLGLTLVKGIADAHGGSVRVSSSVRDGTSFTVLLPRPGLAG